MRIRKPKLPKTVIGKAPSLAKTRAKSFAANRRGDVAEVRSLAPKVQKLRSTAPKSTSTGIRRPRKPSV